MQKIMLAHGGGGQEMNDLINGLIFKTFNNEILSQNNDSAILNLSGKELEIKAETLENINKVPKNYKFVCSYSYSS